jgi:hypothetical protein
MIMKSRNLLAFAVILLAGLIVTVLAAASSVVSTENGTKSDDFTLDGAILGKQLTGHTIDLEECEGRVSVFFIWGIT